MQSDRELLQQALEALEHLTLWADGPEPLPTPVVDANNAITALRERLARQEQGPVGHALIAGALFDFMGWLTTRDTRLVLSASDEASSAVEAIQGFAKMRDLRLDDADVQHWQEKFSAPQPAVQEPVAWTPITEPYPPGGELDILMGDGSVLCNVLPQSDGDLWWDGSGTGEKFIDPQYANVTHWRIHLEATPQPAIVTRAEKAYAAAKERGWQGLTDEEIEDAFAVMRANTIEDHLIGCARAIEAKLKEKNA